jgi:hypothetical protein
VGSLNAYPIHPELVRLGFLDYVAGLRRQKETRLFPRVKTENPEKNTATSGFSQWWTRYRREIGITGDRKKFHSFRSNWTQSARNAGVTREHRFHLAGREIGDVESDSYGGDGFALSVLAPELAKVKYDVINLSQLYVKR